MKNTKHLRMFLIFLAIALVLIPIMIVGITGNGFGEIISHTLISLIILSTIAAVMLGADKKNKNSFFVKISICIGLLIVLASVWL